MSVTVRKGSTGVAVFAVARTGAGGPATGLSASSPGARAAYARIGGPAVPLPLEGAFSEVDADLVPGVYQLALPDEVVADGADEAVVVLAFDGAVVEPVRISLVAYDPQDAERLGMYAIGPEGRIAALRGAFPLVAEREMDELRARGRPG